MRTRKMLHEKLCEILGSSNVYFRGPSSGLIYPCIKYDLEGKDPNYADNKPYISPKRWSLIIIDEDPDSDIPDKLVEELTYCKFDRSYISDGLNHYALTVYF